MPIQTLNGNFYAKDASGNLNKLEVATQSIYVGATTSSAGIPGLVPAALSNEKDMFLKGDGSYGTVSTAVTNVQLEKPTSYTIGFMILNNSSFAVYYPNTSADYSTTIRYNYDLGLRFKEYTHNLKSDWISITDSLASLPDSLQIISTIIIDDSASSDSDKYASYLSETLSKTDIDTAINNTGEYELEAKLVNNNYTYVTIEYVIYKNNNNYVIEAYAKFSEKLANIITQTNSYTNNTSTTSSIVLEDLAININNLDDATTTSSGLMSAADKVKLDGLNNYTHPTYTVQSAIPSSNQTPSFGNTFTVPSVSRDAQGHASIASKTVKIPDTVVSTSVKGLAPQITNTNGYLKGDGTWSEIPTITSIEGEIIDAPNLSVSYYAADIIIEGDFNYVGHLPYLVPNVRTTGWTFTMVDSEVNIPNHYYNFWIRDFSIDSLAYQVNSSYESNEEAFQQFMFDDLPSTIGESVELIYENPDNATKIDGSVLQAWLTLQSVDSVNGTRTFSIEYLWTHDRDNYNITYDNSGTEVGAQLFTYDSNTDTWSSGYGNIYFEFINHESTINLSAYDILELQPTSNDSVIDISNSSPSITIEFDIAHIPWYVSEDDVWHSIHIELNIFNEFSSITADSTITHRYTNASGWVIEITCTGVECVVESNSEIGLRIDSIKVLTPTYLYAENQTGATNKALNITAHVSDGTDLTTSVDLSDIVNSNGNNNVLVLEYDNASGNTVTIPGSASTYYITLTKNTEFIFPSVLADKTMQFTLIIDNPNGTYTATYPSSVQSVNASNSTNITGDEILHFLGVNVNNTVKWYMSV